MASHTPQYIGMEIYGLLVNLQDGDNVPTKDKIPAPNVAIIQRFYCIGNAVLWTCMYSVLPT